MAGEEIDHLLQAIERGDDDAVNRLFEAVYDELRAIARAQRRRRRSHDTLSTTVLVHEAYLKVAGRRELSWHNRVHFFATAATVIRHVLANYARDQSAAKRGGGVAPVPFEDHLFVNDDSAEEALAIHRAISELEAREPRLGRVLECRIFGGMTIDETAAALSVSQATVKRDWANATTWLQSNLGVAQETQ